MHEAKHGELRRKGGRKVRNPKQAIAIALREAGASREQSPKEKRQALRKTKAKERRGQTGQARAEGRRDRGKAQKSRARRSTAGRGPTRAELYERAKRRKVPGRSRMSKAELQRALR
jgi:hypothetical protein